MTRQEASDYMDRIINLKNVHITRFGDRGVCELSVNNEDFREFMEAYYPTLPIEGSFRILGMKVNVSSYVKRNEIQIQE